MRGAALAFLCTPTDVFTIPKDAYDASKSEYNQRSWLTSLVQPFGMLLPNTVSIKLAGWRLGDITYL